MEESKKNKLNKKISFQIKYLVPSRIMNSLLI